jgi:hypothetical protein
MICSIMPPEGQAETTDSRMAQIGAGIDKEDFGRVRSHPANFCRDMQPVRAAATRAWSGASSFDVSSHLECEITTFLI